MMKIYSVWTRLFLFSQGLFTSGWWRRQVVLKVTGRKRDFQLGSLLKDSLRLLTGYMFSGMLQILGCTQEPESLKRDDTVRVWLPSGGQNLAQENKGALMHKEVVTGGNVSQVWRSPFKISICSLVISGMVNRFSKKKSRNLWWRNVEPSREEEGGEGKKGIMCGL